jgi:hypothetical protein
MPLKGHEKYNLSQELNDVLDNLTTTYDRKNEIDKASLITAINILIQFIYDHEFRLDAFKSMLTNR